jgi:hypothetical protein
MPHYIFKKTLDSESITQCREALAIGIDIAQKELTEWIDMYLDSFQPETRKKLISNVDKLTNALKIIDSL